MPIPMDDLHQMLDELDEEITKDIRKRLEELDEEHTVEIARLHAQVKRLQAENKALDVESDNMVVRFDDITKKHHERIESDAKKLAAQERVIAQLREELKTERAKQSKGRNPFRRLYESSDEEPADEPPTRKHKSFLPSSPGRVVEDDMEGVF